MISILISSLISVMSRTYFFKQNQAFRSFITEFDNMVFKNSRFFEFIEQFMIVAACPGADVLFSKNTVKTHEKSLYQEYFHSI
nr:hypothetical protein [Candidatus Enterousia merdequi]